MAFLSEHGDRLSQGSRASARASTPGHMRAFGRTAAVLAAGVLALSCARGSRVPSYPKAPVILVSIDTLRADRLPAYGYTRITTPALDRFKADAWLFQKAYSPCPMTLPSHATMLTGLLPQEHGVPNNVGYTFDGQAHGNLPTLLKQHGYAAGAAVSSYVLRYETGLGAIFDYYEDSTESAPGVASVHYRRSGDKTAAFAQQWIAQHLNEPFFFFFHIYEPHLPYDPPEPFRSRYGVTYDGSVASADAIVGAFLDEMKRLGVYDRAIVMVVSDHGEGLGDHGEEQHSILLYREAIEVPLLLKLPGSLGGGTTIAAPAQLSDLMPTVTALLGLETPPGVTGTSLLDVASGTVGDRVIYAETIFPRLHLGWSELHSVLDGRYHYIHGPRPELYDMVADPAEKHDLIGSQAAVAARLAAALKKFPTSSQAPAPVDEETLRRLAALGYVGGLRDTKQSEALPNPVDSLTHLARLQEAWRLSRVKQYPEAIAVLRAIVKDNPGMVDVWIKLGEVLAEAGLDADAAAAYRSALDLSPVFLPDIVVALGFVQLRLDQLDDAEKAARQALLDVPSKAHELLARVALARSNLAVAEAEAAAAVEARNPQPAAVLVMAEVKLKAGQPEQALAVVDRAATYARELKLSSVYNLEFLRADALARLNRADEAEAAFRREIELFPSHAQAYASLAVIRFIRRDREGANRLLEEMARINPSSRTYLIAATTSEFFGDAAQTAAWRRRAEESKRPPAPR